MGTRTFTPTQKLALASNPDSDPAVLHQLSQDDDLSVITAVASNPSAGEKTLSMLGYHGRVAVRTAVALNPASPSQVLRSLSREKNTYIRECVAMHTSSPHDALMRLAIDGNMGVRVAAAKNPELPERLMDKMLEDDAWQVHQALLDNPSVPTMILFHCAFSDNTRQVREYARALILNRSLAKWTKDIQENGLSLTQPTGHGCDTIALGDLLLAHGMYDLYKKLQSIELQTLMIKVPMLVEQPGTERSMLQSRHSKMRF